MLEVNGLDEFAQWALPWLLAFVGQATELLRVQPKLARHLDLIVGQVIFLARFNPNLELTWDRPLRHGAFQFDLILPPSTRLLAEAPRACANSQTPFRRILGFRPRGPCCSLQASL